MAYLTAAVVLVGVLCVLDLVLTLGVIRRLRDHSDRLTKLAEHPTAEYPDPEIMAPKGSTVGGFSAVTTEGEAVALELLDGPTLVGFFAPGCDACKEQLPEFINRAVDMPGGRSRVLAAVVGEGEAAEEYVTSLAPVARVVVEASRGALSKAFKVDGFPALGLVDEQGVVLDAGYRVDRLETLSAR
jgi:hypothetical protein